MSQIIPTAEPFFFPGNQTGCLLVHGFTGAPKEMRWMGEYLAGKGFSVLGVRLAGHATRPADMIRTSRRDWLTSVEDGYHLLRGAAQRIYLIGLSMGGALSLLISSHLEVRGVVAISTPYRLRQDWRLNFIPALGMIRAYLPKTKDLPGAGWFDPEGWRDHVSYSQNPVRSIGELDHLLADMRAALPSVRSPVLLMHSRDDRSIPPENMEQLDAALVNAFPKTKLYLTASGHVIPRDARRGQAFEAAHDFIRRVESES